ncbi:MAG: CoA-binding protein [Dehalococcoidia bacterium]
MAGDADLDNIFNPKSVAVVGVPTSSSRHSMAETYVRALIQCKFGGPIYPINPKGGEIHGLKIYANVKDTPDSVDYVISCIPAASVPQLVRDCAANGVKAIQFFTSGFSEEGTEEGRRLEAEICDIARQGSIRLIGPNCMGVYCPKSGLSFALDYSTESGPVALICQSGGNAIYFVRHAAQRGVRFSKVVSFGNAVDVDESDLLEYLTNDTETKIITAYIEGLKDGRRFSKVVRRAAAAKPVIMMKGGSTEAGARAAASHTGVLAGSARIWDGLLRQAGVIPASTLEELADIVVTLLYLPVPGGRRLGVIDVGGGAGVVATDAYVSAGLDLPRLPQDLRQKLRGFLSTGAAGLSVNNPVDLGGQFFNVSGAYSVMKELAGCGGIDILVFHLHLGINPPFASFPKEYSVAILNNAIKVHNETGKPMVVVIDQLTTIESCETTFACQQKCQEARIPVYSSVNGAAKALEQFMRYHEIPLSGSTEFFLQLP